MRCSGRIGFFFWLLEIAMAREVPLLLVRYSSPVAPLNLALPGLAPKQHTSNHGYAEGLPRMRNDVLACIRHRIFGCSN